MGVFYFQLAIPEALRSLLAGKARVRYSLETKDPAEAKLKAYSHTVHWYQQFQKVRSMKKPSVDEILANPDLKDFKLGKAKGNWTVSEAKDTADYELGLREIGRLDSLGIKPQQTPATIHKTDFLPKHKIKLQEAIIRWTDGIKPPITIQKTFDTKCRILFEFKQFVGANILLHTIGKKELSDFKLHLLNQQKNSLRTGSNKFIYIAQFFEEMKNAGFYVLDNPATGQLKYSKKQKNKDTEKNKYLPFTQEEIKQIFLPEIFAKVKQDHMYWGCLLGLFTGARVNEICQLLTADINLVQETIYFNVTTIDQSLKSASSTRVIPIHPALIELGFLDYVKSIDKHEQFRLFPKLIKTKNGFGDRLSKDFIKYLTKYGLKQPRKSFHSFRNTLNDLMADNKVPVDYRSVLLGQNFESVNMEHYTTRYSVKNLKSVCFKKLKIEIDIDGLKKKRKENRQ